MEIVRCSSNDINRVSEFYDNVILWLDNNINYPKWKYKIYPSIDSVKYNILNNNQYMVIDNNEIIGAFVLNDDPEGSYYKGKWSKDISKYMVIHGLCVDNNYYGKGIGSKIVNYCIDYGKRLGYLGVRLDIVPSNLPARNLYERLGFKYIGDYDLDRNIEDIPVFSLFELYW